MKVGIISDSHDHHANVLKAVEVFNERKVSFVLHAGDIISPFTAKAFSGLKNAQFIAVFGNNDGEKIMLKSVIEGFGGQIHDDCYIGEIAGKRVFMTHRPTVIKDVAGCGKYDLVVYGHSHKNEVRNVGGTLVINPGETTDWLTGTSAVVIVDLDDMSWEEIEL